METVNRQLSFREVRRRKILLGVTFGVGSLGVMASLLPFIRSMGPSNAARAAGAPVEVDISRLAAGRIITIEWRGRPIWIVHRTQAMMDSLSRVENELLDPQSQQPQQPPYARNRYRSIKPDYFVAIGVCTHLGCIPSYQPNPPSSAAEASELGASWPGGFYCPCHGSRFDLAGRVYKNVPAPLNIEVPQYMYLSETRLLIGEDRSRKV